MRKLTKWVLKKHKLDINLEKIEFIGQKQNKTQRKITLEIKDL